MGGYSAESGSISSLKNTNVSSISVPILHTHSLCLLWKKWSSIHEAIFKHYMVSIRHMMRSHILFSFRPYFHMLRNIGPNHLYVSIPNIRKILRQLYVLSGLFLLTNYKNDKILSRCEIDHFYRRLILFFLINFIIDKICNEQMIRSIKYINTATYSIYT